MRRVVDKIVILTPTDIRTTREYRNPQELDFQDFSVDMHILTEAAVVIYSDQVRGVMRLLKSVYV